MTDLVSERSFQEKLILSFPPEFQGLLGRLNSRFFDNNSCERMFNEMVDFCWITFVKHLIQEFPICLNNNLYFKSKLLLFPLHLQRNLLSLLLSGASRIPCASLQELDEILDKCKGNMDEWLKTLHKLLKVRIKINNQDCTEQRVVHIDIATEKSKTRFLKLCEEMESESSGKSDQQMPWDVIGYKESNTKNTDSVECRDLAEEQIKDNTKDIDDAMEIDDDVQVIEQVTVTDEKSSQALLPEPPDDFMVEMIGDDEALKTNDTEFLVDEPDPQTNINNTSNNNDNCTALQSKVKPLQDILQDMVSLDTIQSDNSGLQNAIQVFNELSSAEMEYACQFLNLNNLPNENTVSILCQSFLKLEPEPSYQNTKTFASHCILPCLTSLQSAASRLLGNIVLEFTNKHTNAACDSLFITLLTSRDLNSFQADMICKVIKEKLNNNSANRLFQHLLETKLTPDLELFLWSDNVVRVIQAIVDSNAILDKELLQVKYLECLKINSTNMAKSLRFTKLILATIKKYGGLVSMHKQTFVNILERNGTFLKKAGLASLKKII